MATKLKSKKEKYNLDNELLRVKISMVQRRGLIKMENRGIDSRTSRMLSERSTIWASSPTIMSRNSY